MAASKRSTTKRPEATWRELAPAVWATGRAAQAERATSAEEAPAEVRALLSTVHKGHEILERLVNEQRMRRAWRQIDKRVNKKRDWRSRHAVYRHVWGSIVTALQGSKHAPPSRKATQRDWQKTAFIASQLADRIRNGRLDQQLYRFYPHDVASLVLGTDWSGLDEQERVLRAQRVVWPSMSEVLAELTKQAERLAKEAITERRVVDRNTRDRHVNYFVRKLAESFEYWLGGPMMPSLAAIASTVFQRDISIATVKRALRK